jgi:hypothetical protein
MSYAILGGIGSDPTLATPRPAPPPARASRPATPTLLGAPDFDGYCRHTRQGSVRLIGADHAYGWRCSAATSTGDDAEAVCAWTYYLPASEVTNTVRDFYNPRTWQCWRVTRQLRPPDWTRYCQVTGHGPATLASQDDAYGWHCADGSGIDADAACAWTNRASSSVSRFQDFYDPPAPGNAGADPGQGKRRAFCPRP